jgi:hypothetical protein
VKATPRLVGAGEVYDEFVEMVELVLELEHPRDGDIASRRTQFDACRRTVEDRIAEVGGEIIAAAWINSTLVVRVPETAAPLLGSIPNVKRVDRPHRLTRD